MSCQQKTRKRVHALISECRRQRRTIDRLKDAVRENETTIADLRARLKELKTRAAHGLGLSAEVLNGEHHLREVAHA